jgi:hypothetical protein
MVIIRNRHVQVEFSCFFTKEGPLSLLVQLLSGFFAPLSGDFSHMAISRSAGGDGHGPYPRGSLICLRVGHPSRMFGAFAAIFHFHPESDKK